MKCFYKYSSAKAALAGFAFWMSMCSSVLSQPDSAWFRSYREGTGAPLEVISTLNGGFAIGSAGWDGDTIRIDGNFGLLLLDSLGRVISNTFYSPDTLEVGDEVYGIRQFPNGDYILAGYLARSGALLRTNSEGEMLWWRNYPGLYDFTSCELDDDQNIWVISIWNGRMLMIDPDDGEIIWQRVYSENGSYLEEILQTVDGGFLLTGRSSYIGAGNIHAVKINSVGNIEWRRTYDTESFSHAMCAMQTIDGGFCIGGQLNINNRSRGMVIRTDTRGEEIWRRYFIEDNENVHWAIVGSLVETPDGGITILFDGRSGLAQMVRLDASGEIVWSVQYRVEDGRGGSFLSFSLILMDDLSYILGGWCTGVGAWLIRTEPDTVSFPMEFTLPDTLDLGEVSVDTFGVGYLEVTNPGRRWTQIDSILITGEGFSFDYELPVRFFPWDTLAIPVLFTPSLDTAYSATMELWVNSASTEVLLQGRGVPLSAPSEDFILYPSSFTLYPAYPNPFNSAVTIQYAVPRPMRVRAEVFDSRGARVAVWDQGLQAAGIHSILWEADGCPTGSYTLRLTTPEGESHYTNITLIK